MSKILSVTLLDRKDGKGKVCRVLFGDANTGGRASRLYHESFADALTKGDNAEVEVKKVDVASYTFQNAEGEEITATSKWIAILKGESEAVATARSIPSAARAAAPATADVQM